MSENGEPLTPREEAEVKAELTVRDAWLSVTETCNMFNDPTTRPFIQRQAEEIHSMRTKLAFLAAALEVSNA